MIQLVDCGVPIDLHHLLPLDCRHPEANHIRVAVMGIYAWAREDLQRSVLAAQAAGYERQLYLRALLGVLVEQSKSGRSAADLAQEMQYLADNLDDGRDYGFMRP